MINNPVNPKIGWCRFKGKECLLFTFEGELTASEAALAVSVWKDLFSGSKQKKITIIWDCKKMTSYDIMARKTWQKALREMKDRIDKCLIITDNRHIYYGALLLSLFTSLDIKVIQDIEDNPDFESTL
ncbi:MAG: hypothetical protein PVF73_12365 [Bacteroidales bacterium]|jgi:hypothetical protein